MKNYYVAQMNNGITLLGTEKSINRIANGTKNSVREKAPSISLEGQIMFHNARKK